MEFVIAKRSVVLNFSEKFCKTEIEVLNSDCFREVWSKYVEHIYKSENQAFLPVLDLFARESVIEETINLFTLLLGFSINEIGEVNVQYAKVLKKNAVNI